MAIRPAAKPAPLPRRYKAEPGQCLICDTQRVHPPHDARDDCQSGKYDHCSCGRCF